MWTRSRPSSPGRSTTRQFINTAYLSISRGFMDLSGCVSRPRLSFTVDITEGHNDHLVPVREVAGSVGHSASRFQHLFSQQIGVPFRRYRGWRRLRVAILEISNGSNFTTAAHAAGFSDQAHFAHVFRRTFGAPPSRSLLRVRTWARAIA